MPLRIAIIGGSIAGCTLANGLLQHHHIHFDIFDGKEYFSERGAGVAIAPNARKALHAMGIDAEQVLKRAGGMEMKSTYCLIGLGEHRGKPILELPGGVYVVDRKQLLDVLLEPLPKGRLHANKKLLSIAQADENGPYQLHFEDGSTHEADAVIGADGARSKVRQAVLGPEHEEKWAPRFGGYWDARGRITPQKAAKQFGNELFDPTADNEIALVDDGVFMLFAPTEGAYHVIVSAAAGSGYDATAWKTQLSREVLEHSYKDWNAGFRTGLIDSLMAEESGHGVVFSEWEHPGTPFYNRDALCLVGDAAHATIPWMGQGACLSIEDAAIMSALLAQVKERRDVPAALAAFSNTRRERAEYVISQSQEAAKLLTGQMSMDPGKVAHLEASKWWTDIWAIDIDEHSREAIEHYESLNRR